MLNRRAFIGVAAMALLTGCTSTAARRAPATVKPKTPIMPSFYGPIENEPFYLAAVPQGVVAPQYWRQQVPNPFIGEKAGTIIVDPNAFYLHLVEDGGTAMRYGIGVGRQGFSWAGDAVVQYKRIWPRWKAPDEMVERQPELEPYSVKNGGMDPGPLNPLGARALYLFQNGEDTLYRIHGNPEANSIGRAVSSGCIRMLNHDIIDLHARVTGRSKVIVRPSKAPANLT